MRLWGRQRQSNSFDPVEISEKNGVRYLHLGGPAVQSAMRVRDPNNLELEYTRAMMVFLLFVERPRNVVLVGLGGGSIAKFIHHSLPDVRLRAVEINPEVIVAARAYFQLPADGPRLQVVEGDGAYFVEAQKESVDVLLVDGYDAKRIVEALSSPGFYTTCFESLRPGGCAVFNLWGTDRFFETYRERIEAVFGHHVLLLPAERKGNIQVFAFREPMPDMSLPGLVDRARQCEAELGLELPRFLERMRQFNPVQGNAFCL